MKQFGINDKAYNLIIDCFKSHPELEIVKIMGSRANNTYREASDIDLIAKFTTETDNLQNLEYIKRLKNELDNLPTPYEIDIFDIEQYTDLGIHLKYNFEDPQTPIFYRKEI